MAKKSNAVGPVRYETIRRKLKTGDIVLYSGKGLWSAGIKWVTGIRWSHVGMVLWLPEEFDFLTVWESTTDSSVRDIVSGDIRKGVQLVPLSKRVRSYDGDIAVRRLRKFDLTSQHMRKLMKLRKRLRGRPYEKNLLELMRAALDGSSTPNEEDLGSIFCSELVAEAYQRLGLLDDNGKPSNEYTPADFAASGGLKLKKGKLGKEIQLYY